MGKGQEWKVETGTKNGKCLIKVIMEYTRFYSTMLICSIAVSFPKMITDKIILIVLIINSLYQKCLEVVKNTYDTEH